MHRKSHADDTSFVWQPNTYVLAGYRSGGYHLMGSDKVQGHTTELWSCLLGLPSLPLELASEQVTCVKQGIVRQQHRSEERALSMLKDGI